MRIHPKYILIMSLNLIFLNSFICSNYIMNVNIKNSIIIFIFIYIIGFILLMILPKNFTYTMKKVILNKYFRTTLVIYILLSTLLICYVLFNIISIRFFFITPTFLLIIFFCYFLMIGFIVNLRTIINTTFVISIILIILGIIPFINFNTRDFNLLLRLDYNLDYIYVSFFIICFIFDNLLFLLIPSKDNINKKDIMISTLISFIVSLWFIVDNYTYLDYSFFTSMNYPGLYRYKLYFGPKYIEHFDNFLNIFLICYIYLKCLINGKILKVLCKVKNNFNFSVIYSLIISIITIILFYSHLFKISNIYIPLIILTFLILNFYYFLIRGNQNEV